MSSLERIVSCIDGYDANALPVEAARAVVRSLVTPIAVNERVAVRAALGRVLGEDVVSPTNVPAHDNSAMDGWAVRSADLLPQADTRLREIGASFAGRPFGTAVGAGECVRVMTGAVMPAGADAVVLQEVVRTEGDAVIVPPGQARGQHVRFAGEDIAAGQSALRAGQPIRPAELGLLASLGIAEVAVRRRPRVAFFSTGDELVSVGRPLAEGEAYDSNRYTLYGMLTRLGCEVIDMGVVRDDRASLARALGDASAAADAVVTSGGVSVGEADFTREVLASLGEVLFWKIAMRPGRPMAVGKLGDAFFFGLPGNPVAVMVTFYQFVRDALLALAGRTDAFELPALRVPCETALRKKPGRTEFQRGILTRDASGQWTVRVTGSQGSGVLRSMSEANCFIVLEHDRGSVQPGDLVSVQVMDGLA
ncbi:MAG: molybdopterin molybdotransferase MoeA [Burkholderiales bacterium]|nr:molybdopterin molybdotransferase MoeA [Burkholderiales bacterium]